MCPSLFRDSKRGDHDFTALPLNGAIAAITPSSGVASCDIRYSQLLGHSRAFLSHALAVFRRLVQQLHQSDRRCAMQLLHFTLRHSTLRHSALRPSTLRHSKASYFGFLPVVWLDGFLQYFPLASLPFIFIAKCCQSPARSFQTSAHMLSGASHCTKPGLSQSTNI
jgi:hypothetical protein